MTAAHHDADYWIDRLALRPHPEGGYFRETYRAAESIARTALPPRYDGARTFATAIYFLLPSDHISALHRLRSDEIWHFHLGSPLTLTTLADDGAVAATALGGAVDCGERLQAVIPAGVWFGATIQAPRSFALVGCTVAPGFDFADFELADREVLAARFPQHRALLETLTRR
jgi:predicted cupin superfamily sugar epimerase